MLLLFPVGMQIMKTYIWKKTLDPHSFKSRQIVLSKSYEFLLYFSAGSYYMLSNTLFETVYQKYFLYLRAF